MTVIFVAGFSLLGLIIIIADFAYQPPNDEKEVVKTEETEKYQLTSKEWQEAFKELGEIENEKMLADRMMNMSLQKVQFKEDENFKIQNVIDALPRIQMSKMNIRYMRECADDIEASQNLVKILDRWLVGDFSNVNKEFIETREALNPSKKNVIPEKRTEAKENEYILHFFGKEGLKIHQQQWK